MPFSTVFSEWSNFMNKVMKSFILLFFILLSLACQSHLPKDLPNDLEIRLESNVLLPDGSPRWWFRSITISGNQMNVEFSKCQVTKNVTLENRTIENLYQSIAKSEFDLIKEKSEATGKDGERFQAIYLKAGNISKLVKYEKEKLPLSESDWKRFDNIWASVRNIATREIGVDSSFGSAYCQE